jgi:hypothetical protein
MTWVHITHTKDILEEGKKFLLFPFQFSVAFIFFILSYYTHMFATGTESNLFIHDVKAISQLHIQITHTHTTEWNLWFFVQALFIYISRESWCVIIFKPSNQFQDFYPRFKLNVFFAINLYDGEQISPGFSRCGVGPYRTRGNDVV